LLECDVVCCVEPIWFVLEMQYAMLCGGPLLEEKLWYFFYSNFYNVFQFLVLSTAAHFMGVVCNGLNGM